MVTFLSRWLIQDYDRPEDPEVRRKYGVLCGSVGIGLNLLLFLAKFFAGTISGSVAITADAFNNLADSGSSVVTLLGFKLANRKPDPEHPFGHGRMEYLSGLVVAAVVTNGTEKANDYQIKLGQLDTLDSEAITKEAAETALRKLGGEVAPTGQYPVIFNSEAMSDLLRTYSGIFSSEAAQKGLSKLAGKEGEVIASEIVTLVDDPFHPESPMPMPFDAEGSPTAKKNIIENGVFNTLLYNLKTAAVAGKETTGNASKAGYDAPVGIRPFTMYLAGGALTPEELLQKAGNGVYINSLGGLHAGANAVTGDFSLQSAGFMIENGVKTTAVKSFTVAGNFYEMLKNIVAVANNSHLPTAMGMTAFGAPDTLVEGLSIAGK